MKKKYISPRVGFIHYVSKLSLLAVSSDSRNIGYGGKDTGGVLEPDSKSDDYYNDTDDLW